ncbi:zona pellucida sperm-binding protein 3-like [Melanotaenia boesemani]|uniref:zona pellucida sperm-binding protein 3-like n=1 Tax=Melanotaenia boesemani TaxID=1250792 RepID=UPI001C05D378|nr:zona pellucida sperm-binding protein 3-like [Melanotaenia boesemani]
MMVKLTAVCLVGLALLASFCDGQSWGGYQKPSVPQNPTKQKPAEPPQQKHTFEKELTWTYPSDPQPEPKVDVPFEQRYPVPAATVAVECREDTAHVEVKKDLFGIGQFIDPADLTLGTCAAVAEDTAAHVLIYESALHQCGSVLTSTDTSLVYTFTLNYSPKPLGSAPVVRTSQAAVIVECHYPRKHNVSSLPLDPLWVPFSAVKMAEEFLYFSLKLMTDDFLHERPSYQYFLGDLIRIEATVKQYFHVPLRVYVDNCVATLSPDSTSNPRYAFIDNHGCMLDGRITGSDSKFLARTVENKLQFQLEAFRFQGANSGLIYITCHLIATSASHAIDTEHRACSYTGGWKEASGADAVCGSCESSGFEVHVPTGVIPGTSAHGSGSHHGAGDAKIPGGGHPKDTTKKRPWRDVSQAEVLEWEGDVTLGPIPIEEKRVSETKN